MKKRFNLNSIQVMLILILLSQVLSGQEGRGNGRVGGTVKDDMGKPIADAKITLQILSGVSSGARKMLNNGMQNAFEPEGKTTEEITNGYQMNIISDKKGQWGIFGFATGQFILTAEKEGYEPIKQIISLSQMKRNPLIYIVMQKKEHVKRPEKVEFSSENGLKIGNALYNEGKYEEALLYFQELITQKPDQFEIGINLGNCYMALRKYDEGIKVFINVIEGFKKENPGLKGLEKVATIYANIGEAYSILGNYEQALIYYKKSMEVLPPSDAAAAYNTAEILFNTGKAEESITYYSLAAQLKPEIAIYYVKLGYAYLSQGDKQNALANFEKFVKLAPNDQQIPTIEEVIKSLKQ